MRQTDTEIWVYREQGLEVADLIGFDVQATDGAIGAVDAKTRDSGADALIVDTGPWIFGKKVMLPAGVIQRVDLDSETVFVERTKDEIKSAPEFDEATYRDEAYRDEVGGYYHGGTAGTRRGEGDIL
ncbi:MAG: PRC-barrel domain containing protein [Gaiellaceae bacterium]